MLRGCKIPLKVKENGSGCPRQKEEVSFPPSRDQKSCKVTKSKVIRPSKKENFTEGSQTRPSKRALKDPEQDLCHLQGSDVSWQLPGSSFGLLSDSALPLHTKEDFSSRRAVPLGNDCSTPGRNKAEGASPTSLKFRRRSTIGLRGSPENNTLIKFLAQQRRSRQEEAFTQISPFKPANVSFLKDSIAAFQAFESLQEAEGESGLSHLGEPSQERGSSQNRGPFTKDLNLEHWREKFMLGNRGADLKENLSGNGTKSSRSELRICNILSPDRAVTALDPPPAKEWVSEQEYRVKSLEPVVTGDTLEAGHVSQLCARSQVAGCERSGSDAVSDLSPRKAGLVEDVSLGMLGGSQTPGTPLGTRDTPSSDLFQSSSLLRPILKKSPWMELWDNPKEYSNSAIDRGGGESAAVSSCVRAFEMLQTETTDSQSSKTPKKKKVTFGEVLSPEIFDQSLPANSPLCRGASPRPFLTEEHLLLLDEDIEPLPEFLEGSVAAEAPSPAENAEVVTDKADTITTRSFTKRKKQQVPPSTPNPSPQQSRAVAEGTEQCSWGATSTEGGKGSKNPRTRIQRQKNPSTAAPEKTQKRSYGKRRKKKVDKSLYGKREIASKKPLLSPISENPEFSPSVSYPNSPKADALFTEDAAVGHPKSRGACRAPPQAGRMHPRLLLAAGEPEVPGSLESAPEFSNAVPDAKGDFDTCECFQQGEETPCEEEAKERSFLTEKEDLHGNFQTGLELLKQWDVQEGAQRTKFSQKASLRDDAARRTRRSSSAFYFPPVENLAVTGADLLVSYSLGEVLSVPQAQEGSLQGCRRRSSASAGLRVRRSMRLSKDAAGQGLAWIQLPGEIPPQLPLAAAPKGSTSILAGAENLHHGRQKLLPFPAPGKENEGSALAARPGGRLRRRSLFEPGAKETPWAPTQRMRSRSFGGRKDQEEPRTLGSSRNSCAKIRGFSGIPNLK